jgi:hypothetical protein
MKAIRAEPKKAGTVRCEDFPEPDVREGSILVEAIAASLRERSRFIKESIIDQAHAFENLSNYLLAPVRDQG